MRALSLAILCSLAVPTFASDLTFNGRENVDALMNSSLELRLTGAPGSPAFLLLDLDPGPTQAFAQQLDIGFSPALNVSNLPVIPPDGSLEVEILVPSDPSYDGLTLYAVATVASGAVPSLYDWSQGASVTIRDRNMELVGEPLGGFPHFEFVTSFHEREDLHFAVDVDRHPEIAGRTGDVYIVEDRTRDEWIADASLLDVSSNGADTFVFTGATVSDNTFLIDAGMIDGDAGAGLGVPFDLVIDLNQNGVLDEDDFIDGYGDQAGFYVVEDPSTVGPYSVVETTYSGGTFLGQNLFYPSNIASLGELPIVIVSHGNGHNYQWYNHLGEHLASYGYIVMSHQNNTVPGINSASTTTLTNTDYFLGNLDIIEGGLLDGHVDVSRMMWIGHSRGGEGVARAYDRIFDGLWTPVNYTLEDIQLVSSIAPTNFLGPNGADAHDADYSLWTGGADADVNGCSSNNIIQTFTLLDRPTAEKSSISLHGVGHGDFHNGPTGSVASGPCLVGRSNTHAIMRGYILPLAEHYLRDNPAAQDFLWRQWESFNPPGAGAANPCVVVDLQHRPDPDDGSFVLDDFQTNTGAGVSSSGGSVNNTGLAAYVEGRMDDTNTTFTVTSGEAFNGFTQAQNSADNSRGIVFAYTGDASLEWQMPSGSADLRDFRYLNFRACQATRNANTTAVLGDHDFSVELEDGAGNTVQIPISVYGGGIEEPYQRGGCGSGVGWANEFETVRIALDDFTANGQALAIDDVVALRLLVGPSWGNTQGRLGLDDLAFTLD